MRRAVEMGADCVGAIPHFEMTREDGVGSVEFAMALADEHGLLVDIHCDETDDEHSRFVEVMVAETIRLGLSGRVTASHTTAMHSYNAAYAYRLINNIARAGPAHGDQPARQLGAAGALRHRADPSRPHAGQGAAGGRRQRLHRPRLGDGPVVPARLRRPAAGRVRAGPLGQMSGDAELRQLIDMITPNPARALGVADYGLRAGARPTWWSSTRRASDALRLVRPRTLVLRGGEVVARASRPATTVVWDGAEEDVTFATAP